MLPKTCKDPYFSVYPYGYRGHFDYFSEFGIFEGYHGYFESLIVKKSEFWQNLKMSIASLIEKCLGQKMEFDWGILKWKQKTNFNKISKRLLYP